MLDTLSRVTTPELIELELHPAGLLPRSLAWLLDLALRIGIMILVLILTMLLGRGGMGLYLLAFFLVDWFYPVLFEVLGDGSTPGKRALGLRVVQDNGTPVGWGASLIRNLMRSADLLPFAYGAGLVCMLCHPQFRRLGDIAAGTLVVYRPQAPAMPAAPPPGLDIERVRLPAEGIDRESLRAILAFDERARALTAERQEELAALLPEFALAPEGPQGARRLFALAALLRGSGQ